jgi:DNA polymerase-3 subunit alpha
MPDATVIEELFCLAQKYPGRHPLQLTIKSKLQDIIIESKMKVSRSILIEAKNLGIYEEEKLVVNG